MRTFDTQQNYDFPESGRSPFEFTGRRGRSGAMIC